MIKLRILGWVDYLGGPSVIMGVFIRGKKRQKNWRRRGDYRNRENEAYLKMVYSCL